MGPRRRCWARSFDVTNAGDDEQLGSIASLAGSAHVLLGECPRYEVVLFAPDQDLRNTQRQHGARRYLNITVRNRCWRAAEQIGHNRIATLGFIIRDILPHVDAASQVHDATQRQRFGNKQWTRSSRFGQRVRPPDLQLSGANPPLRLTVIS